MTGNDLVDLKAASKESNWKRKGFLIKLFNENEQALIHAALVPEEMVWLLWSMKEAAYKIYNKRSGIRAYAPLKLNCEITAEQSSSYLGVVRIAAAVYHTKSTIITGDYIHTIAAEQASALRSVKAKIYRISPELDYKPMAPACVSHHGQYLALIF